MTGTSIPDLTDDAFLADCVRGAVSILQPRKSYRAGLDAVLLAAAVPETGCPDSILDAGAGVGTVGLCIARRLPTARVVLAERDSLLLQLAQRNIARNNFSDRVEAVAANVALGGGAFHGDQPDATPLRPGAFDHVAANPPYYIDSDGTTSPDRIKARAHAMPREGLDAWMRFLATACTGGGTATLIHRADAIGDVLKHMMPRFGAVTILPIHPRNGLPANRVLVQGRKGSRAPTRILPGLILHTQGQAFRPEIDDILRRGAPLQLD